MKKADVEKGVVYLAKVSGKLACVRIVGVDPFGGWNAIDEGTGRIVHIRRAQWLRRRWLPDLASQGGYD